MNKSKTVKRLLLSLITATLPVIIAACYGVYYTVTGKVIDADTEEGLGEITITCNYCSEYDKDTAECSESQTIAGTVTNSNGYYELDVDNCDIITATDDNEDGIQYEEKAIQTTPGQTDITIELQAVSAESKTE